MPYAPMVKGAYKNWIQPISFTFSNGPVTADKLMVLIKTIIRECQTYNIVATICEQGAANVAAINKLLAETKQSLIKKGEEPDKYLGFFIGNQEIVPLLDVPHLFKGIRNNLITKELHFTMNGENLVAKWDHILQFYFLDISDATRICPKLTDLHVIPNKIQKMKVSYCTQVFSNTVGSLMKRIANWNIDHDRKLEKGASDTAELILFLDKLFDSLNGNNKIAPVSKPLKGPCVQNSPHEEFWNNAIKVIQTMKFYCPKDKTYANKPASQKNLIRTLRGFIYLQKKLLTVEKFDYVLTRRFNQDVIENFFALIRSDGHQYTNPSVQYFVSSFKSIIITNFLSSQSPHSNCEDDMQREGLDNLRCFLTGEEIAGISEITDDSENKEYLTLREQEATLADVS